MIKSFKDEKLERCWKEGKCCGISQTLKRRILMKLDSMDAAVCLEDLRSPPGNRLHQLNGDLKDYWTIAVSGAWRLIFKYENNDIFDISLEQYH